MIVTGGYVGIGTEITKALLMEGARVYVFGRSPAKAIPVIEDLKKTTGNEYVYFVYIDFADFTTIRPAVEEFQRNENTLHVLFNNAGLMVPPIRLASTQGYDLQMATNCMGPYILTQLLLPLLEKTAQLTGTPTRVVDTSSNGYIMAPGGPIVDPETVKDGPKRIASGTYRMYGASKAAVIMVSKHRARTLRDKNVVSFPLNPGFLTTELGRYMHWLQYMFVRWIASPPQFGALTQLYCGTTPEAVDFNGQYFIPWARRGIVRQDLEDVGLQNRLVDWLNEELKDYLNP